MSRPRINRVVRLLEKPTESALKIGERYELIDTIDFSRGIFLSKRRFKCVIRFISLERTRSRNKCFSKWSCRRAV